VRPAEVRQAYDEAATAFRVVVDSIGAEEWDRPALGEWTVRELVAHTLRALLTVEAYLGVEATKVELRGPAEYFRVALDASGIHADVAARARTQVTGLGDDPAAVVAATAGRVLALVDQTPDDRVLGTFVGGITLADYLPSRVVELVVHTLDLCAALGREPLVGRLGAAVTLSTLGEVAAARPATVDVAHLVRALTGRAPWPDGCNVLG
jgi:uncharacterized protein (TIGR03083 family)